MRILSFSICSACIALTVAACAPKRQQFAQQPPAPRPCEMLSGTATTFGRATAARYAELDLRRQAPDLRGELLADGLTRIKAGKLTTACEPYPLTGSGAGVYTCTTRARVCGRLAGR